MIKQIELEIDHAFFTCEVDFVYHPAEPATGQRGELSHAGAAYPGCDEYIDINRITLDLGNGFKADLHYSNFDRVSALVINAIKDGNQ